MSTALLESVRSALERTYRMRPGIGDLAPFVIGDEGFRRFYDGATAAGSAGGEGARTLVRETQDGVRACIYYPDALIRHLEANPPQRGVADRNVDAFAVLVEELDHLLVIAERAREARPASLVELELHADVSKYVVLRRFVPAADRRAREARGHWLRYHLFHKAEWCDPDPAVRDRYRDAARWALRFLDGWERCRAEHRLDLLRRFHAATLQAKLRLIDSLAA